MAATKEDAFRQCLRLNLDKLELELLQAHAQALQLFDAGGLNRKVPYERDKVLLEPVKIANHKSTCDKLLGEEQLPPVKLGALQQASASSCVEGNSAEKKKTSFQTYTPDCALPDLAPESPKSANNSEKPEKFDSFVLSTVDDSTVEDIPGPELTLRSNWLAQFSQEKLRQPSVFADRYSSRHTHKSGRSTLPAGFTTSLMSGNKWKLRNINKCYIHPFSRRWITWELFGFVFLIHDIIFVPMQVFDIPPSPTTEVLKFTIMIYWTLTCFLTFFVSYQHHSEIALITDQRQIIRHYLKGWFALDFAVIGCDWISAAIDIIVKNSEGGLGSARMARMARMGRIFRLARLLRVMRIGEMLLHVKALIDSEWTGICFLLASNVAAILFLAHLTACIWFGIGDAEEERSWLQDVQQGILLATASFGDQYLHALGWSLSTLLGSAVSHVRAQTQVEFTCALLILVIGTIVISLVFSSTTAAMTRLHELQSAERQATFNLKTYLKQNQISTNLKARVIRYVDIAKSVHSRRLESENVVLLNLLSGPLRLELQLELHSPHLILHPFFQSYHNTNATAMSELCWSAVGFMFLCRCDSLFQTFTQAKQMYFVVTGTMVYRRAKGAKNTRPTAKIEKKEYFCEGAIWTYWIHRGGMKALIESQILALDIEKFVGVSESHHDAFLKCCDYARRYLLRTNEQILSDGYVWDVEQEAMYPDKYEYGAQRYGRSGRFSRFESPNFVNMLREAEDLDADLMDTQSDSDSEDERMFHMALKHQKSLNKSG